jgi:hypothetical protein
VSACMCLCGRLGACVGGLAYSVALMTALHVSGWRVCVYVLVWTVGRLGACVGWLALLGRSHDRTPREWLACVSACVCACVDAGLLAYSVALMTALHVSGGRVCMCACVSGRAGGLTRSLS